MKRFLAIVLVLTMMLGMVPFASAGGAEEDMPKSKFSASWQRGVNYRTHTVTFRIVLKFDGEDATAEQVAEYHPYVSFVKGDIVGEQDGIPACEIGESFDKYYFEGTQMYIDVAKSKNFLLEIWDETSEMAGDYCFIYADDIPADSAEWEALALEEATFFIEEQEYRGFGLSGSVSAEDIIVDAQLGAAGDWGFLLYEVVGKMIRDYGEDITLKALENVQDEGYRKMLTEMVGLVHFDDDYAYAIVDFPYNDYTEITLTPDSYEINMTEDGMSDEDYEKLMEQMKKRVWDVSSEGINPAATGTAYQSTQTVTVDDKKIEFQMYKLVEGEGETNYIKLRDLAYVLNGTDVQFNVDWTPETGITIASFQPYTTANGQEMKTAYSGDQAYAVKDDVTYVDGYIYKLQAFTLQSGSYTYYKLRDLGMLLDFYVGWSYDKGVYIDTTLPYGWGE